MVRRGGRRKVAPRNVARAMPSFRDVDEYLKDAWAELHAANDGLGWLIGRPAFDPHKVVPGPLRIRPIRDCEGRPAIARVDGRGSDRDSCCAGHGTWPAGDQRGKGFRR